MCSYILCTAVSHKANSQGPKESNGRFESNKTDFHNEIMGIFLCLIRMNHMILSCIYSSLERKLEECTVSFPGWLLK